MTTRYEEQMYKDIHSIAKSLTDLVRQQQLANAIAMVKLLPEQRDNVKKIMGEE